MNPSPKRTSEVLDETATVASDELAFVAGMRHDEYNSVKTVKGFRKIWGKYCSFWPDS